MGLSLYLVGLLALASGASHMWRRKRQGVSSSPFATAEVLVGVTVVIGSAMGMSRWSGAPFVVVSTLAVVMISVVDKVRRTLAVRRKLLASEAERLENRVRKRVG